MVIGIVIVALVLGVIALFRFDHVDLGARFRGLEGKIRASNPHRPRRPVVANVIGGDVRYSNVVAEDQLSPQGSAVGDVADVANQVHGDVVDSELLARRKA